jgi:outer membrane protein assembly factor BamB
VVRALDAASGIQRWERFAPNYEEFSSSYGGLLATGGGLMFGAARGQAFALESATGKERWSVFLGGRTLAPPISYSIDGHQVITLLAGRTLFSFGL